MSDTLKISGKKVALPDSPQHEWTFTSRPGGWMIAESKDGVRRKVMAFEHLGRMSVSVRGFLWSGEWIQQSRDGIGSASDSDLVAQFPGRVRKVLCHVGILVSEGDSLILIDAMKMEFSIRAPYAGKVVQILVQEGQQLSSGERLVELEAILDGR